MEPAADPTPLITWTRVATPDTAILAAALVVGLVVAVLFLLQINAIRIHLRATRIHVRETRDWFRRNAAEQRAADYHTLVYKPELLTRLLSYTQRQTSATLQDIRDARTQDPEIIEAIHSLLTYYDGLARGVELTVLSERVVRAAHHENMLRALRIFRPYIDQYRIEVASDAWSSLERILIKWDGGEDAEKPRPVARLGARKRAA